MKKLFSNNFIKVVIILLFFAGFISICFVAWYIIESRVQSIVKLQTNSLEPNYYIGQKFFVTKPKDGIYRRGELVVYNQRDGAYIHRIIGLPEETVQIIEGKNLINGIEFQFSTTINKANYSMEKVKLEKDEYFLLGDNRKFSLDSHIIGPIKLEAIRGIAEPIP
jgi:signal peptidase I